MTGRAVTMRAAGAATVAVLPAEIDMVNITEVRAELAALLACRPGTLIVDMTQTTFCDSAGVATLVRLGKEAAAAQVTWRLAVSQPVRRVVQLLGADQILDVYPSLEAALGRDGTAGQGQ